MFTNDGVAVYALTERERALIDRVRELNLQDDSDLWDVLFAVTSSIKASKVQRHSWPRAKRTDYDS